MGTIIPFPTVRIGGPRNLCRARQYYLIACVDNAGPGGELRAEEGENTNKGAFAPAVNRMGNVKRPCDAA